MTELRGREKRKLFAALLQEGVTALHLDPRRPGVIVPGRFGSQGWLVLNYSFRYGIADFRFTDQEVEASLSFGGQPFYCRVPWTAVFAITDNSRQRGRIWHDEVPADVDSAIGSGQAKAPTPRGAPRRNGLTALPVRSADKQATGRPIPLRPAEAVPPEPATAKPPRRPGLRLIAGGQPAGPRLAQVPPPDDGDDGTEGQQVPLPDAPQPPSRPQLRRIK